MKKLFSSQDKKFLSQTDEPEKVLQQFICDNWNELFPQYTFIMQEFILEGAVHASGKSGRIDILAYNTDTQRFVFFELKKNYDKNIGHQAANYRYYIQKNFLKIYVDALQKYETTLSDKAQINDKEVEIILVAKGFSSLLIEQAELESLVTLIKYNWFENDLVLFDYVSNAPDIKAKASNPVEPPNEIELGKMTWDEVVNAFVRQEYREKYQVLAPDTKDNIEKLRQLASKIPVEKRRIAVHNWLNQREKHLEQK